MRTYSRQRNPVGATAPTGWKFGLTGLFVLGVARPSVANPFCRILPSAAFAAKHAIFLVAGPRFCFVKAKTDPVAELLRRVFVFQGDGGTAAPH
jgi:hypothetical protein